MFWWRYLNCSRKTSGLDTENGGTIKLESSTLTDLSLPSQSSILWISVKKISLARKTNGSRRSKISLMLTYLEKLSPTVLNMKDMNSQTKIPTREPCYPKSSKQATVLLTSSISSLLELTKSDVGLFVNSQKRLRLQDLSTLISRRASSAPKSCVTKISWVWVISRLWRLRESTCRRARTM